MKLRRKLSLASKITWYDMPFRSVFPCQCPPKTITDGRDKNIIRQMSDLWSRGLWFCYIPTGTKPSRKDQCLFVVFFKAMFTLPSTPIFPWRFCCAVNFKLLSIFLVIIHTTWRFSHKHNHKLPQPFCRMLVFLCLSLFRTRILLSWPSSSILI